MKPLEKMIDSVVKCLRCGKGMKECQCYEKCSCGWFAEKGKPCNNPKSSRCTTKVKYGKYNKKTKRYE